jgi:hypothetical protein
MKSQALWSILISFSPTDARRSPVIFAATIDFFAADGTMQADGGRRPGGARSKTSKKAYMIAFIRSFHQAMAGPE